jgi:hypothetical protein
MYFYNLSNFNHYLEWRCALSNDLREWMLTHDMTSNVTPIKQFLWESTSLKAEVTVVQYLRYVHFCLKQMIVEKVTKELNLHFLFSTLLGMLNVYNLNHSKQQVLVLNEMERQE